ncbi:MAG: LysR family transcriptional regulator [Pseudomonadota bacterium]
MHKMNWQDLHYVLVVARSKSVAAAARSLGVTHSTVLRRINALEERQGVRLFDRLRSGYVLNPDGQQLLQAAQTIEETIDGLERRFAGKELKLEGTVRVTTTDSILVSLVSRHLAKFKESYPDITLELSLTSQLLSLTRRDADVAIRPSRYAPDRLSGVRVSDFLFAVYAAHDYWREHQETPLSEQPWLGPDDALWGSPAGRWLHAELPEARIIFSADSFLALADAAARGLGLVLLPCCQGDDDERLGRISEPLKKYPTGMWILAHKDLLKAARVRTFYDFMIREIQADIPALLGAGHQDREVLSLAQ